jgi:DNA-binding transcriptional regulator YhcF (GntR family)
MEFIDKKAIYLQIAEFVCEKILLDEFTAVDKIPSIRELAVQVEVNLNTVQRSYKYLQQNEIIFTQRGRGYFVNENAKKVIKKLRREAFLDNDLPQFFKNIYLLEIDLAEIELRYRSFLKDYTSEVEEK